MNKVRWEEIMAVAAKLFREKGYMATTMDDIAAQLYITKPALYYYIKTKHDLLYEICETAINHLMERVAEIKDGGGSAEERLHHLVTWHVSAFSTNGDIINVYLADEGELPPEKREYIRGRSREFEAVYRDLVRELVSEGTFREVDVAMAVRAISGMCNWLSNWYRSDGSMTAEEIADVFIDLVMNGLKVKPGGAKPAGGAKAAVRAGTGKAVASKAAPRAKPAVKPDARRR